MAKKYDVVATTGTYEKDGETKYINKNVGSIIGTKHGFRLKLDASFNPAGCKIDDDGGVWLALFEPKPRDNQAPPPTQHEQAKGNGHQPQPPADDFDDDVPF